MGGACWKPQAQVNHEDPGGLPNPWKLTPSTCSGLGTESGPSPGWGPGPSKAKETHSIFTLYSSVAQPCPTLCDPMNHSMPGLPVHHQLPESTQTHVH